MDSLIETLAREEGFSQTVDSNNSPVMESDGIPRRFVFFSGHEGSTVAILKALGQPDPTEVIPFASMVLFEL